MRQIDFHHTACIATQPVEKSDPCKSVALQPFLGCPSILLEMYKKNNTFGKEGKMNTKTKYTAKPCAECDTAFSTQSSHSKYCPVCAARVRRQQTAERVRRYRERLKEAEQNWATVATK